MYIENGIEKLSKPQISKLLNGHKVRIKQGNDNKIHLTEEHSKKLHRAHMKGAGTTIQLDPYAIATNQHLRQAVAAAKHMVGLGRIGTDLGRNLATNIGLLADAGTQRGIAEIQGSGAKKSKGRPPKAMTGSGPKGLKKFKKWTGAIGDFFKPVAKPILEAATNQAVNNINAYGEANAMEANPYGTFMDALGGQGLPKHRGRPRKVYSESPNVHHKKKPGRPRKARGGAALPPGTPYGIY